MNTQLTAEDKARIFAMYTNTEEPTICHRLDDEDRAELMLSGISNFYKCVYVTDMDGGIDWLEDFNNVGLHLYDLCDISDEDAVSIFEECKFNPAYTGDKRTDILFAFNTRWMCDVFCPNDIVTLADCLRRRSFALDYKGVNLFDAGIAIRKTKTT